MGWLQLAGSVLLLIGCIEDRTVVCGDVRCPVGSLCTVVGCATPEQIAACSASVDGDTCSGSSVAGVCESGVCEALVCGDGRVVGPEACDDGNQRSGDGCSADCLSREVCGNDYVDVLAHEECDAGIFGLSGDGCTSTCTLEVPAWKDVSPTLPITRDGFALAFDARRGRTVMYGGNASGSGFVGETWEWNGATWFRRTPSISPPPNFETMAFDAARGVSVLFGANGTTAETWTWDGSDWIKLAPTTSPPPRGGGAIAYDPVRKQIVLFGGFEPGVGAIADTWLWNGTTWTQATTASAPSAGGWQMAWDGANARLVLVQGIGNKTWGWNGASWSQLAIAAPADGLYGDAVVATNAGGVIAFDSNTDKTYTLGAAAWTVTATSGPGLDSPQLAFDSARGRVVQLGGSATGFDTWDWDGTSWSRTIDPLRPNLVIGMAYDPLTGVTVAMTQDPLTWLWDGVAWTRGAAIPPTRQSTTMVTAGDHVLLFGGYVTATGLGADTWTWNGTWTQLQATSPPPGRDSNGLAYDTARARVVMFGGENASGPLADTWELDGSTWIAMTPAHVPPARTEAAMAYDRRRHVTVLFGGYGASSSLGDTWEWDGVDWTERTPAHGPEPREGAVMIYHPLRRTIMLVDGGDSVQSFGDTWEWDGTAWSKVSAVVAAPPLFSAGLAFDARRGEMTAFGVDVMGSTYLKLTLSFAYNSAAAPHDRCDAAMDTDGDGLVGCADPDCWGRCTPLCPPGEVCDPAAPHCGDGTCSVLEDHELCPDDCS